MREDREGSELRQESSVHREKASFASLDNNRSFIEKYLSSTTLGAGGKGFDRTNSKVLSKSMVRASVQLPTSNEAVAQWAASGTGNGDYVSKRQPFERFAGKSGFIASGETMLGGDRSPRSPRRLMLTLPQLPNNNTANQTTIGERNKNISKMRS